jgi:hypothetical protein
MGRLSGLQVDIHPHRRVAVNRGVETVAAEEEVGTLAALKNVVAVVALYPIVAAEAEDPIVAIRYAVAVEKPPKPEKIMLVGSIDLGHGRASLRQEPRFPRHAFRRTSLCRPAGHIGCHKSAIL